MFHRLINDLEAGVESIVSKLADDPKLGGAVGSLEGQEAFLKDPARLAL